MAQAPLLFVTDLDGTALGAGYKPYGRFPNPYSAFLDRLHAAGCAWAINTTWGIPQQWELVLQSSVVSRPAFFMGELGLRLAQYTDDGPKRVEPFTLDMEERLRGIRNACFDNVVKDICSSFTPEDMRFYGHWFEFTTTQKEMARLTSHVEATYLPHDTLTFTLERKRLLVYPAMLNKSHNLREALRVSGIPPERGIVAGDEVADIAMMDDDLSGFAVCPENAHPDVKARVREHRGEVGIGRSSYGIIDAMERVIAREGWEM